MRSACRIPCGTSVHTLRYDGELQLLDHDLDRDLAFQALRDDPPEGCLAVLEAWTGLRDQQESASTDPPDPPGRHARDFLEAMLIDDNCIRGRMVKELEGWLRMAPRLERLVMTTSDGSPPPRPADIARRARWQLVLLALPRELGAAYCRSLRPELAELDDEQLRRTLIGAERSADVLRFPLTPRE